MSWVGIANNQTVSFNNLQDAVTNGYFVALAAIPASQEQITKTDAATYANIDTTYGPYAAKASNQLVVKSNLRPISYAYTVYYRVACYYDGFYIEGGDSSGSAACSNTLTITLYSPVSSFSNGMSLFYDSACSNPWYGDTGGCGQYYKVIIAGSSYYFTYANSGSTVGSLTACSTTTYVTITAYVPYTMTCFSSYSFAAAADYTLNTTVTAEVIWYGDLGGSITRYIPISTGTTCNTSSFSTGSSINCLGEYYSYDTVTLDIYSYGSQIYQIGSTVVGGTYPC